MERGRVEEILGFSAEVTFNRVSGKETKSPLVVSFAGNPPREVQLVDGKKQVKKRMKFDPAGFRYR